MEGTQELPKVTPFLLRTVDDACARRVAYEYGGEPGTRDPVNRSRVRSAVLDAVRTWSATGTVPAPLSSLEPEEQAIVAAAVTGYCELFPEPVADVELPVEQPTELTRRGIRLGGWVDLGVTLPDGTRELRQVAWGARNAPADPLELESVRLAVLRIVAEQWATGPEGADGAAGMAGSLTVVWADLLNRTVARRALRIPGDLVPIATWLDERLERVRERVANPEPTPGRDCAMCRFVPRCPAHSVRGSMAVRAGSLFPAIPTLSPTALDTWSRCRREFRDRVLLSLPPSDPEGPSEHGLYVHQLLRFAHEHGSCHDPAHVEDVLTGHGADDRVRAEVARHVARCPRDAEAVGHEREWARANPGPPVFMATARLDAVWAHDGVLEVRDYKTGRVAEAALADDPRAWLQAWVAAPVAAARGLRLRLRYEHLATEIDEDPEPWEPGAEELAVVGDRLATTVNEMLAERDWNGVGEPGACGRCRYRSICPDSAAASGEPVWSTAPGLDDRADDPVLDDVSES